MDSVLHFLITDANADTTMPASVPSSSGSFSFVLMFFIFFAFLYIAIWRPQNKRAKEQQELFNSLAKGDEVLTSGGLLGRISKINDQYIGLTVANNVEMLLQKSAVVNILPKGTLKSLDQ